MPNSKTKLKWCKARIGEDMNWWVKEISDPIHWDIDGLGIIDPRQLKHLIDLLEPLNDYGLETDLIEESFYTFIIGKIQKDKTVVLNRVEDSILDNEEQLFVLPDVMDEEKGPYAELINHLIQLRIKMLNHLIDFSENLTAEELEEELRETQNADYMEGRSTHFFSELTAILEYVPAGFDLEEETDHNKIEGEEIKEDISNIENSNVDEDIEADETMKWDGGDEEEETTALADEVSEEEQ